MEKKEKVKPDWENLTDSDRVKLRIAEETGVLNKIIEGGYRSLTAKESGRIGGIMKSRKNKTS